MNLVMAMILFLWQAYFAKIQGYLIFGEWGHRADFSHVWTEMQPGF
jgi:hypothetical protein